MTGNVNHIVYPASNPVVPVVVAVGTITGELEGFSR